MTTRKTLLGLVFLAGVCGLAFRSGERSARAAINCTNPPPPCVEFHAVWRGGFVVHAYFNNGINTPGDGVAVHNAEANVYTPGSPLPSDPAPSGNQITRFTYTAYNGLNCNPVKVGLSAVPQEVNPDPTTLVANSKLLDPDYDCVLRKKGGD